MPKTSPYVYNLSASKDIHDAPIHYRAPYRWHETIAKFWKDTCAAEDTSPSVLNNIAQLAIRNERTVAIAKEISAREGIPSRVTWDFKPNNPNFYALLGTPNGQGISKLLGLYAGLLATRSPLDFSPIEVKTIAKVKLWGEGGPGIELFDLVFVLEDSTSPPNMRARTVQATTSITIAPLCSSSAPLLSVPDREQVRGSPSMRPKCMRPPYICQ